MSDVKERNWKEKFTELPPLLKIVVVWVYFISITYWLKFLFILILHLSLSPFNLAFGYLIWALADGLINRDKIARIIALVYFSFFSIVLAYIILSGGRVSIGDFALTTSSFSIVWIVISSISILILLLPHIQKFFLNSSHEDKYAS
ncbi:MAG: hypothetical protein JNK81_02590 [Anaerolineales bacterium]|nr:hypothetical protein [Anaerolineales bacterium]